MAVNPDAAFSRADFMRRLEAVEARQARQETARRLESASVGRGGLRIHDGGGLRIHQGGGILIEDGGQLRVIREDGRGVVVEGGASMEVLDGGAIVARYPNGEEAVFFGSLLAEFGGPGGHGLLVSEPGGGDIFIARRNELGVLEIGVGTTATVVDIFSGAVTEFAMQNADGSRFIGYQSNGNGFFLTNSDLFLEAGDDVVIGANGGTGTAGTHFLTGHGTTSATSPVAILQSAGALLRSTSSRRYKTDISDYGPPRTILDLAPRRYRDRAEAERDPASARENVGLIAEEVHDLGLHEYVIYDELGNPDGVAYDRLAVGLLGIVRDLTEWAVSQGYQLPEGEPVTMPQRMRRSSREPPRRAARSQADPSSSGRPARR